MNDFVTPILIVLRFFFVGIAVIAVFFVSKVFGHKLEGGALWAVLAAAILASFIIITPPFSATERDRGSEEQPQPGYSGGSLHLR